MMPFTTIMEPWETFTNRTMKQPNIQRRMLLRAVLPKIEPEGWGDNAIKDTFADLQWKVHEKTKMNMSSWRHGNLYKFEEILYVHEHV